MTRTDEVMGLMTEHGGEAYHGEAVTQLEHALQAAYLAQQAGSEPHLVAAALLHDVGHLLHAEGEDAAARGIDTAHEEDGYRWVLERFGARVADPVRHHVAAKRYLCRIDPGYLERLSAASLQSLRLQGGPFNDAEAAVFGSLPCCADAVALRRWDDEAKVVGLHVPELEAYRGLLDSL